MNRRLRKYFLEKIAQTTSATSISGSPPEFIAPNYYPIVLAFSTRNTYLINNLTNIINQALYYTSNGKIQLQWMKNQNFNFDTSGQSNINLKNLMGFAKMMFNTIFTNNGAKYIKQLSPQEINDKVNILKSSTFLNLLSATNPIGQLASKIGGNVKTLINNTLNQIK